MTPRLGIGLPQPGSDEDYLIDEAGLVVEFEQLRQELTTELPACQILGRPGDFNGDSREEAVKKLGGKAEDYGVLWKLLHGLISYQDLSSNDFSKVLTVVQEF